MNPFSQMHAPAGPGRPRSAGPLGSFVFVLVCPFLRGARRGLACGGGPAASPGAGGAQVGARVLGFDPRSSLTRPSAGNASSASGLGTVIRRAS